MRQHATKKVSILRHAGLVGEVAVKKIRQHATKKASILGHAALVGEVAGPDYAKYACGMPQVYLA